VPLIQPLNIEELFQMLTGLDYVICVEEHFLNSGLGSILSREYGKINSGWKLYSLGIPYKFLHEIKDVVGMREHFGISGEKIADFVKNILR
jgi:transketolase C-terminal domain/subunit